MIKILLADDHAIILDGLKAVLDQDEGFEVIGTVSNGEEVLSFIDENKVDLIILDINMPKMDGLKCAKRVKEKSRETKIIVLTMYGQQSFINEMIKIGVDGCILKSNTGMELKDVIHRVMSGKSYFDQIQSFNNEDDGSERYKLGKREIQIVKMICEGISSQEIADRLYISEHTVKSHRKNIFRKTNVHSTAELIQFALNNGIME